MATRPAAFDMDPLPRTLAVDWSGARVHAAGKIWLAESCDGRLIRLENGRSREAVMTFLIEESKRDPRFIVGFDFAFSFPVWFCEQVGAKTVVDLWRHVGQTGEQWLALCGAPFWGRRGTTCLPAERRFRKTERDIARRVSGARPKSVFQIGGPGAVGTGSLRGMPILEALREAGFSIWPFDPPGWPMVVEIYPRALTGPVNKSSHDTRLRYVTKTFPNVSRRHVAAAGSCEDAFDAAVSALVMQRRIDELTNLAKAADRVDLLEGRIWY